MNNYWASAILDNNKGLLTLQGLRTLTRIACHLSKDCWPRWNPPPSSPPPKIKYIMCLRIASRCKHAAENVTSELEATRLPCSSPAGAISRAQSSGQTAPIDVFRDEQTVPCTVTAPCLAWVGSGNGSWENSSALPRLSFGCMENPCRIGLSVRGSGWGVGVVAWLVGSLYESFVR